jgi:hypothetical protein
METSMTNAQDGGVGDPVGTGVAAALQIANLQATLQNLCLARLTRAAQVGE